MTQDAPTPEEALELVRVARESVNEILEGETHPALAESIRFVCLRLLDTIDEIETLAPGVGSDDLLANYKVLYYVAIANRAGDVLNNLAALNEFALRFGG